MQSVRSHRPDWPSPAERDEDYAAHVELARRLSTPGPFPEVLAAVADRLAAQRARWYLFGAPEGSS